MALHSAPKGIKRFLALKALAGAEKKLKESKYKDDPALLQTISNIRTYLHQGHSNF